MEIITAIALVVAIAAIAHALDVRRQNERLFKETIELAKANGALMGERRDEFSNVRFLEISE